MKPLALCLTLLAVWMLWSRPDTLGLMREGQTP